MSAKVRLGLLACGPCRRPPQIPLRLLRRDTSQCIDHHEPYNILEQQHSGISRKFKSDDSRTFKCLNLYSTCIVRKCVRVCVSLSVRPNDVIFEAMLWHASAEKRQAHHKATTLRPSSPQQSLWVPASRARCLKLPDRSHTTP